MDLKISKKDPFQIAWRFPEKAYAIYVDADNGLMVIPDAHPVVNYHLMVIAREHMPFEDLPDKRKLQMLELANITAEHLRRVLKPKRKVGYCIWGNKIKTAHIHLLPRNKPDDGAKFFSSERPRATHEFLAATQKLLEFPDVLKTEAISRVSAITV